MNILWQNIVQAIRSLRTQAWQVAISSVSLAVGIVCLTFSSNWLWSETHYDSFCPDYEELYMLGVSDSVGSVFLTPMPLSVQRIEELRLALEGTDVEIGHYERIYNKISLYAPEHPMNNIFVQPMMADSAFASLLRVPVLYGDVASSLSRPDGIVLTDSLAMCFFGRKDVVGETLYKSVTGETYVVGAVIEANRRNTHFNYNCLLGMEAGYDIKGFPQEFRDFSFFSIMRIPDIDEFHARTENMQFEEGGLDFGFTLHYAVRPLATHPQLMHKTEKNWDWNYYIRILFYPWAFFIISLLLVVAAVTNLVMVFTSINLSRVREYALRRSMGATAWQNVQWILIGVIPTLLIAIMLAGVIMEWTMYFSMDREMWGDSTQNSFYRLTLAAVISLCLLGMAFPVWRMRMAYRESFLGHGGNSTSHTWLIVIQCVVSSLLLYLSIGMQRQMYEVLNAELGYEHKDMLRLHTKVGYGRTNIPHMEHTFDFTPVVGDIVQELEKQPGIIDVIAMQSDICNSSLVTSFNNVSSAPIKIISTSDDGIETSRDLPVSEVLYIPCRALEFFGIQPLKGGGFTELAGATLADELQVVVTPELAKQIVPNGQFPESVYLENSLKEMSAGLGIAWDNSYRRKFTIMGVADVKPYNFKIWQENMMFVGLPEDERHYNGGQYEAIYIKHEPGRREEAEAAVRSVLKRFDVPDNDIHLCSAEEYIKSFYKTDRFYANMLTVFGTVSVVITLAGIFSMLLYSLRLRRCSMAIHRVMGATFKDIFVSTIRPYLLYAVIGAVVAYFPAYHLMDLWMGFFQYGEMPGVGLMLAILAAMCGIITLIVWWQVSVCMKEKPVEILKPEA